MRFSILQLHPCPECCGNVRWYARQCPHCGTAITPGDRFDWLSQAAKAGFFAVVTVLVFLAGCSLLLLAGAIGLL
ncbi:MAG TPA: hypothetical protein VML55_06345 [Planctomycetaceae bacterium]|nr:hypothetical protein [Planctomycetaceae bacterium]